MSEIPFEFGLYDENGILVATAQNQDGTISFPQLAFTEPGTYHYTIRELTPSGTDCWLTDESVHPVTVTITRKGSWSLRSAMKAALHLLSSTDTARLVCSVANAVTGAASGTILHAASVIPVVIGAV